MRDVTIPLDRVPRALYQRAALGRDQTARAVARVADLDLSRGVVRVEARITRPLGYVGRCLDTLYREHAHRRFRGRTGGADTVRLVLYALARPTPAGEGLGLVRTTRARPCDVAAGAVRGHDPVWTLYSPVGEPLLVLDGCDDPAPWEAPAALPALAA